MDHCIGENAGSSFMLSGQALVFDDATEGSAPKTQPFKTGVFGPLSCKNLLVQEDHQPPGLQIPNSKQQHLLSCDCSA